LYRCNSFHPRNGVSPQTPQAFKRAKPIQTAKRETASALKRRQPFKRETLKRRQPQKRRRHQTASAIQTPPAIKRRRHSNERSPHKPRNLETPKAHKLNVLLIANKQNKKDLPLQR